MSRLHRPAVRLVAALLALAAVLPTGGCGSGLVRFEASFLDVFDTVTTLTAYADSQAQFDIWAQAAHDELTRLHQLFDIYHEYDGLANLRTVNGRAGAGPVAVEADILDLLEFGLEAHEASGGAVNIALGAVSTLWRQCREAALQGPDGATLPDPDALAAAGRHCRVADIVIDRAEGTVALLDPLMTLDVGAIAKGWAAGRAMDKAAQAGMEAGVLSAGGNIVTLGRPADGRSTWRVGIRHPRADVLLGTVRVGATALVSSGDYERYFTVDGVRYHHILDPETLMPATGIRAVTVVAADSAVADMLSTALFVLPMEDGRRLLERYDAQALWVDDRDGVTVMAGFPPFEE